MILDSYFLCRCFAAGSPSVVGMFLGRLQLRRVIAILIACLMSLVIAVPALSAESEKPSPTPVDLRPGDVVKDFAGVKIVVPRPGETAEAEAILIDGTSQRLAVSTSLTGRVSTARWGDDSSPLMVDNEDSASPPDECSDGYYELNGGRWDSTFNWFFSTGSSPSNIAQADAVAKIKEGTSNITGVNTNCPMSDQVSATAFYGGANYWTPNITVTGTCTTRDGYNVVDFGDLPADWVGLACWRYNSATGIMWDSDFRFNKVDARWYVTEPSGCTGDRFSIEAVTTHERGHNFGLDHGSNFTLSDHGDLTMAPLIERCQNDESNLGKGDILGLEALY